MTPLSLKKIISETNISNNISALFNLISSIVNSGKLQPVTTLNLASQWHGLLGF